MSSRFLAILARSLIAGAFILAGPALAGSFHFQVATEEPVLTKLATQTEDLLPSRIREMLTWSIELSWGDESDFIALDWRNCASDSMLSANLARSADPIDWLGERVRARRIILNPALRSGALSHQESCLHGDATRTAESAILHEIARIADRLSGPPRVSESAQYLALSGFYPTGVSYRSTYRHTDLPHHDRREWSGPGEHFAVNFEAYLLDPRFACERPGMNEFFKGLYPKDAGAPCGLEFQKTVQNGKTLPIEIDPSRVYRIDLIETAPGSALESAWGHTMLRVIVCAPYREQIGPDCLQDLRYHVFLTFYSDPSGRNPSLWSSLSGEYDARLYVAPFLTLAHDYVVSEERPLSGTPLKLSRQEIRQLLAQASELNRYYTGRWYDLTQNCVTQAFDLMVASVESSRLEKVHFSSPHGLMKAIHWESDLAGEAYRIAAENLR